MFNLKIYSRDPLRYIVKSDHQTVNNGVPNEANDIPIEEYDGDEAKRAYWYIKFDSPTLPAVDKKLILAVFPNLFDNDAAKLKDPSVIAGIARKKAVREFGLVCPRCGGIGNVYTNVDHGICFRCRGRGKILPRLTDKKISQIADFFKAEAANEP